LDEGVEVCRPDSARRSSLQIRHDDWMTQASPEVICLLRSWLERQLSPDAALWLTETADRLARSRSDRDLFLAVSLVARRVGKHDLQIGEADRAQAEEARAGWDPRFWSTDQAARLLLLLSADSGGQFASRLEQLFATADLGELLTFYRGLPSTSRNRAGISWC
jgi:hypothetical protein